MKKLDGVRKIITITPNQDKYLRHTAHSLQITTTELIRRLIDKHIEGDLVWKMGNLQQRDLENY